MCIIIDANVVHKFGNPRKSRGPDSDARPVLARLLGGPELKLVLGGRLTEEILRPRVMQEMVNELDNVGRVYKYDDKAVRKRTQVLIDANSCKSDDQHVIALAQIARARLLFSQDRKLCQDFANSDLIAKPEGLVYQHASQSRLLDQPPECFPPRAGGSSPGDNGPSEMTSTFL